MKIDDTIATAEQAIQDSIQWNRIAHVCLSIEEADKLGCMASDCVQIHTEPRMTDYWGTDENGDEWRVYDYAEPN